MLLRFSSTTELVSFKMWLTIGRGGFDTDLIEETGLFGGIVLVAVSVELLDVMGLAGWDKLCSGAWNV